MIFALFVTKLPQWAQSLIGSGRLAAVPGRLLEDSFGLAALAVIVIMYRLRPSLKLSFAPGLRVRLEGTGRSRAFPRSEPNAPAGAGLPEATASRARHRIGSRLTARAAGAGPSRQQAR